MPGSCSRRRASTAYFNTATVGLASRKLLAAYRQCIDEWERRRARLRPRRDRGRARAAAAVARLIGAAPSDVAQIASVSAAAGLVAAQLGPAAPGRTS